MAESVEHPLLHEVAAEANCEDVEKSLVSQPKSCSAADILTESKKLWMIAGPAILTRISGTLNLTVTQAFVGHIGDLELAAMTISSAVILGLNMGLLLGMGSALETMCGQAFGAKKLEQLGVYLQRAWILLFVTATLLLPVYIFATPILKFTGQTEDISEMAGRLSIWLIPMHYSLAFNLPMQTFLQSQLKNFVIAWMSGASTLVHILLTWLFTQQLGMGIDGAVLALNITGWLPTLGLFLYATCGGCPSAWTGYSMAAFKDLWPFTKLSLASGVMLCLEIWYFQILVVLGGLLKNAEVAVDALSICMNINALEFMIPIGFLAATGVRVANELGSGNGNGAKFAAIVAACTSLLIGVVFTVVILVFRNDFALIFTSSKVVIKTVSKIAYLLGLTMLLGSVQPVLSGVAVGSGWQSTVAFVNIGCYYLVGVPLGIVLGWVAKLQVLGIWAGMICGSAIQTTVLLVITGRFDWEKEALKSVDRVNFWARSAQP